MFPLLKNWYYGYLCFLAETKNNWQNTDPSPKRELRKSRQLDLRVGTDLICWGNFQDYVCVAAGPGLASWACWLVCAFLTCPNATCSFCLTKIMLCHCTPLISISPFVFNKLRPPLPLVWIQSTTLFDTIFYNVDFQKFFGICPNKWGAPSVWLESIQRPDPSGSHLPSLAHCLYFKTTFPFILTTL